MHEKVDKQHYSIMFTHADIVAAEILSHKIFVYISLELSQQKLIVNFVYTEFFDLSCKWSSFEKI